MTPAETVAKIEESLRLSPKEEWFTISRDRLESLLSERKRHVEALEEIQKRGTQEKPKWESWSAQIAKQALSDGGCE